MAIIEHDVFFSPFFFSFFYEITLSSNYRTNRIVCTIELGDVCRRFISELEFIQGGWRFFLLLKIAPLCISLLSILFIVEENGYTVEVGYKNTLYKNSWVIRM